MKKPQFILFELSSARKQTKSVDDSKKVVTYEQRMKKRAVRDVSTRSRFKVTPVGLV